MSSCSRLSLFVSFSLSLLTLFSVSLPLFFYISLPLLPFLSISLSPSPFEPNEHITWLHLCPQCCTAMAAARTHATSGFCLCHLLSIWRVTGRLGIYLGYYNVSYAPQEGSFVCDEQLYVQLLAIGNLFASVAYLWLSQHWIYDQLLFRLYTPLFVYCFQLRFHRIQLLNECAKLQAILERTLGTWLCVTLRKESVLALLLPLELMLLLGWQYKMYYGYQFCFIASLALLYYLQLMFLGNYLIWLGSIYRALNEFLLHHMCSSRVSTLRTILRQELLIWPMHQRIISYFSLHLLSFVFLIAQRVYHQMLPLPAGNQLSLDRLQLVQLILQLALLITLLLAAQNLQQQRQQFQRNYLHLEDRLEYFELKSWCLLRHQTMPMPFGLPLLHRMAKPKQKRDVITMLVS